MFLDFFILLRRHHLPVTLPEYLMLLDALRSNVAEPTIDDFYFLSKTALVKHEQHLDLFDRVFGDFVAGRESVPADVLPTIPPDWLKDALANELTDDEKAAIEATGGFEELWERFRKLMDEQNERHEGGNRNAGPKWIGTAGTSPFGGAGFAPEGFKTDQGKPGQGQPGRRTGKATKVWENRDYKNYADDIELNTRNMKMALRRLRILTREGAEDELNIDGTIDRTSRNAGMLDIQMQSSKQNRVKVLMLFDVGGSMDDHIELCNQLFSAARYQFKHLEFLYFHNCVYETLWKDNHRRKDRLPTWEVLHKYNKEYKVIFVGDASMSPYEITTPKGSVEHYNQESGLVWLERFKAQYPHLVWLNPMIPAYWQHTQSLDIIRQWAGNRMFPLTLNGLTGAMKSLKNPKVTFEG